MYIYRLLYKTKKMIQTNLLVQNLRKKEIVEEKIKAMLLIS